MKICMSRECIGRELKAGRVEKIVPRDEYVCPDCGSYLVNVLVKRTKINKATSSKRKEDAERNAV